MRSKRRNSKRRGESACAKYKTEIFILNSKLKNAKKIIYNQSLNLERVQNHIDVYKIREAVYRKHIEDWKKKYDEVLTEYDEAYDKNIELVNKIRNMQNQLNQMRSLHASSD